MKLVIEPVAITQLTGDLGYAERLFGKNVVRANMRAGAPVQLTRNGVAVKWENAPRGYQKFAIAAVQFFKPV